MTPVVVVSAMEIKNYGDEGGNISNCVAEVERGSGEGGGGGGSRESWAAGGGLGGVAIAGVGHGAPGRWKLGKDREKI